MLSIFDWSKIFGYFGLINKDMGWTKLKEFTDDQKNSAKMIISVHDWVENIVGKGDNAG